MVKLNKSENWSPNLNTTPFYKTRLSWTMKKDNPFKNVHCRSELCLDNFNLLKDFSVFLCNKAAIEILWQKKRMLLAFLMTSFPYIFKTTLSRFSRPIPDTIKSHTILWYHMLNWDFLSKSVLQRWRLCMEFNVVLP